MGVIREPDAGGDGAARVAHAAQRIGLGKKTDAAADLARALQLAPRTDDPVHIAAQQEFNRLKR